MNRLDRLTSILVHLQSKRLLTAREIARRYEVSIRTIYRDIQTLRQAGVPIGEEEGRGYFIVDGYHLPPVMFTPEEANAMVAAEKVLAYHSEVSLRKSYGSALMKVKAVLRDAEKDKLDYLESRTVHHAPWAPSSAFLAEMQHALVEQYPLRIHYHSRLKDEALWRDICPYALYFTGAVWSVVAHCLLRNDLREFRLDRVLELEKSNKAFVPNPQFEIQSYMEERARKKF